MHSKIHKKMIQYGHKPYGFHSMPIENIIKSQEQGKLFGYKLKAEIKSQEQGKLFGYKLKAELNNPQL